MGELNNVSNTQKVVLQNHIDYLSYVTERIPVNSPDIPTESVKEYVVNGKGSKFIPESQKPNNSLPICKALLPSSSQAKSPKKRKPSRRKVYSKPRKRVRKKNEVPIESGISFSFSEEIDAPELDSDASSDTIILEDFDDIPPVQKSLSSDLIGNPFISNIKPPELGKLLISDDMIKSDFSVKVKEELIESNIFPNNIVCSSLPIPSKLPNIKNEPVDFDNAIVDPPALPEISSVFPVQNAPVPNFRALYPVSKSYPDFCFKEVSSANIPKPKQTARKRTAPRNSNLTNNNPSKKSTLKKCHINDQMFDSVLQNQDFLTEENGTNSETNCSTTLISDKNQPSQLRKIVQAKNKGKATLNKQTKSNTTLNCDTGTVFPNLLRGLLEQQKLIKSSQKKKVVRKKSSPKKLNSKSITQSEEPLYNVHEEGFLARDSDDQPVYLFPFENRLLTSKKCANKSKHSKPPYKSVFQQFQEQKLAEEINGDTVVQPIYESPVKKRTNKKSNKSVFQQFQEQKLTEEIDWDHGVQPVSESPVKKRTNKKSKKEKQIETSLFEDVLENKSSDQNNWKSNKLVYTFPIENKLPTQKKTIKKSKNMKLAETSFFENVLEDKSTFENDWENKDQSGFMLLHKSELPKKKAVKNRKGGKLSEELVFQNVHAEMFSTKNNVNQQSHLFLPKNTPIHNEKTFKISKNKQLSEELRNALEEEFIVTDNEIQPACLFEGTPLLKEQNIEHSMNVMIAEEFKKASEDLIAGSANDVLNICPSENLSLPKKKKPKRSPRKSWYPNKKKKTKKINLCINSIQTEAGMKSSDIITSLPNKEQNMNVSELNPSALEECVNTEVNSSTLCVPKRVGKKRSSKKKGRAKKRKSNTSKTATNNNTNVKNFTLYSEHNFKDSLRTTENLIQNDLGSISPILELDILSCKPNEEKNETNYLVHSKRKNAKSCNSRLVESTLNPNRDINKSNSLQDCAEMENQILTSQSSMFLTNNCSSVLLHNEKFSVFNSSSKSILPKIKSEPNELVTITHNNLGSNGKKSITSTSSAANEIAQRKNMSVNELKKHDFPTFTVQCDSNKTESLGNITIKTEVLSDDECSIIEVSEASSNANAMNSRMSNESSSMLINIAKDSTSSREEDILPNESFIKPLDIEKNLKSSRPKDTSKTDGLTKPVRTRKDPILSRLEDITPNELLLGTRSETKRLRLLAATSTNTGSEKTVTKLNLQTDKSNKVQFDDSNIASLSDASSSPNVTQKSKSKQVAISRTEISPLSNECKSKQIPLTDSSFNSISDVQTSSKSKEITLSALNPNQVPDVLSSAKSLTQVFGGSLSQITDASNSENLDDLTLNPSISNKSEDSSDEEDLPLILLKLKEPTECGVKETGASVFCSSSNNLNAPSDSNIACDTPEVNNLSGIKKPVNHSLIQELVENSDKQASTLTPVITNFTNTALHDTNDATVESGFNITDKSISIPKIISKNSQKVFNNISPVYSDTLHNAKPSLADFQESFEKGSGQQNVLISAINIKKEKDVWPEEIATSNKNDNICSENSSSILINNICSAPQNCMDPSFTRTATNLEENINFALNNISLPNTITSLQKQTILQSQYNLFINEIAPLKGSTGCHQALTMPNLEYNPSSLASNETGNLNTYSPITINEMNKFDSRNVVSSSNKSSIISNFLSYIPSDISTAPESRNLTSDGLMDSSFSFNNGLSEKSEDLDSSFLRVSTPLNQDICNRNIDSASPWIGNENSSDSMQTHSSSVSFSYQNYDFSSSENLTNYEKNMKFFFKFPFPGDILSGFYKCRNKLKGKNYLRANPLPWNLSYEEVAFRMRNATANGVDKGKDESDINDLQYYPLIDEEIGCYHKLLGVAPSKKLINKCLKFDLKSVSEQDMQDNSSLLSKSSTTDYCGISSVPSIFITDTNEDQGYKQRESITELLHNTRRNVESLLPSETRHTFSPIEGSSKNVKQSFCISDKVRTPGFSDCSDSRSISTTGIPNLNNALDNSLDDFENLSDSQNTLNFFGSSNNSVTIQNPVNNSKKTFYCDSIASNEKQGLIPKADGINLVSEDSQSNKLSKQEIILDKAATNLDNSEKFPIPGTNNQNFLQPKSSSDLFKSDILTKVLQTIGLSNLGIQKAPDVNYSILSEHNKINTDCISSVEDIKISENNVSANSVIESKELKSVKDPNILPGPPSNSFNQLNGSNSESMIELSSSNNKNNMLEYLMNNIKEISSNVITSSSIASEKNLSDNDSSSNVEIVKISHESSKNNVYEEHGRLAIGEKSNLVTDQSLSASDTICCEDKNIDGTKSQSPFKNALNSIVSLNTDDLKMILQTVRTTNLSDDCHSGNVPFQASSINDVQYSVSDYNQVPNQKPSSVDICSDYMYYDYHSPFLKIPTVRDYDHKPPSEMDANEINSAVVNENVLRDNTKTYEEPFSDSDHDVDNEFLPECNDPDLDNEKIEDNPTTHVQNPSIEDQKSEDEKKKLDSEESNKEELPQYKSRWERIMERKAVEKNKDEDKLLSYFHLSRSRRSDSSKKANIPNPPKKSNSLGHKFISKKNKISIETKNREINKDAIPHVASSDNSTCQAKKFTKVQKTVANNQIKDVPKKDLSPSKKSKFIGKKQGSNKVSQNEESSLHKKSESNKQVSKLKLNNKISPIKKKTKLKSLSLSDDSSSNLFTPDKVIKVIDEKKSADHRGKDEKDKKKIYGRITNRGSFLTQSPLSDKPRVIKTIQTKKSSSKLKVLSTYSDEIHSKIITPNIELTAGTSTLPRYAFEYFEDPNYKDNHSNYDYLKKRHSISNSSDMSISPITDFSSPTADTTVSFPGTSSSSSTLPYIQSGKSVLDPRLKTLHPVLPNKIMSPFVSSTTNIPPRREMETAPVFQSSLVSSSTFNFDSLSNQSNDRSSGNLSFHNVHSKPKQRLSKCVCLPPRHMKDSVGHTIFETINVLLLILEWNVDWLFQQRKNSNPPPISKCVNKVINTYENFLSYYNTYFPLLLLETWQRIYVSWNHLHTAPPYICEIAAYSVEKSSIKVECQTIFNPADADRGLFPEEGNIIMVKFGTKSKGGIKTLGYITDVKVRAVNPTIDSQCKCYQFQKYSPSDHLQLLQMSFIGAYTSEDFDIKLPIRVHVLCNVKINLKQNDALLKTKDCPLGKNILNPLEDELRVVELPSRDSINETKITDCVKELVKGILSPHPIPIITIVKSYPSSDRLMILPPLIKKMKDSYGTKVLLCARTTKCLIDIGLYLDENSVKFVITGKRADVPLKLKKYLVEDLAVNRALSDKLSEDSGQEDPICKENLKQDSLLKAKKFVFKDCDVILSLIKNCHDDCLGQAFADGDSISQLCCIIDEANLCTEPEILIPVLFGISKLFLIGNPDVSAKVCSKTASTFGFGKSLFHRAYELDLISE